MRRPLRSLPVAFPLALTALLTVAVSGWWWSFEEQTRWATTLGFTEPRLLPVTLDGLVVSLAIVAFHAALDGRPAIAARAGTAGAVLLSATSNAAAAAQRSHGDRWTVIVASVVPAVAAGIWEVFLGAVRRQVDRYRGVPAPAPIPVPRLIRFLLSPRREPARWRHEVLRVTASRTPHRDALGVHPGASRPAVVLVHLDRIPSASGVHPECIPRVRIPGANASREPAGEWSAIGVRSIPDALHPGMHQHNALATPRDAAQESSGTPSRAMGPSDEAIIAELATAPAIPSLRSLQDTYSIGQKRATKIRNHLIQNQTS